MERQRQEIDNMVQVLQRLVQKYGKRIINRQLDVQQLTVSSLNGFELTLTDKRQQQTAKVQTGTKQFRPILTAAQAREFTAWAQRNLNYEIDEDLWLGECIYELALADVEFGIQRAIARGKREFFEEDANGNRLKYIAQRLREQGYDVRINDVYETETVGLDHVRKYFSHFQMTVKW